LEPDITKRMSVYQIFYHDWVMVIEKELINSISINDDSLSKVEEVSQEVRISTLLSLKQINNNNQIQIENSIEEIIDNVKVSNKENKMFIQQTIEEFEIIKNNNNEKKINIYESFKVEDFTIDPNYMKIDISNLTKSKKSDENIWIKEHADEFIIEAKTKLILQKSLTLPEKCESFYIESNINKQEITNNVCLSCLNNIGNSALLDVVLNNLTKKFSFKKSKTNNNIEYKLNRKQPKIKKSKTIDDKYDIKQSMIDSNITLVKEIEQINKQLNKKNEEESINNNNYNSNSNNFNNTKQMESEFQQKISMEEGTNTENTIEHNIIKNGNSSSTFNSSGNSSNNYYQGLQIVSSSMSFGPFNKDETKKEINLLENDKKEVLVGKIRNTGMKPKPYKHKDYSNYNEELFSSNSNPYIKKKSLNIFKNKENKEMSTFIYDAEKDSSILDSTNELFNRRKNKSKWDHIVRYFKCV
jgi:hypothetical protein